jgi:hypothetical protein
MAFIEKFRFRQNQPTPTKVSRPFFAPGWLAQNQRTAIRALVGVLAFSGALNAYQFHLREQIAQAPPETFAMLLNPDFSTAQVVNARNVTVDQLQELANAEVRRFVYRLRRIDDSAQVRENLELIPCHATGTAAAKAGMSFERGNTAELLRRGQQRVLHEDKIRAYRKPGEKPNADGMWVTAKWIELVEEGTSRRTVEQSAEFRVQQFKDISPELRRCNPLGTLITDYELLENN